MKKGCRLLKQQTMKINRGQKLNSRTIIRKVRKKLRKKRTLKENKLVDLSSERQKEKEHLVK